jgi:SAM-dependent methyltransferase
MNWPKSTHLTAVDHCPEMIAYVFPHVKMRISHSVHCADWKSVSLPDSSIGFILCDGGYAFMRFPEEADILSCEMKRVLSPEGRFTTRVYIRPERPEEPEDIFSDLFSNNIQSFHTLKWRLAMAMHGSLSEGVCLGDVWELWAEQKFNSDEIAKRFCWSRQSIATIHNYRGLKSRYYFPTMIEAEEYLRSQFHIIRKIQPNYELGERCPIFVLAPRY